MAITLEQERKDKIFGEKVKLVMATLAEVFGPIEMSVVFQAIANWIGMLIFNTIGNPLARRECARRFQDQLEQVITEYERGRLP